MPSISTEGQFLRTPKLLDRLKDEYEVKTMKE
jgi:hypothetical protein